VRGAASAFASFMSMGCPQSGKDGAILAGSVTLINV
jgi:hypothetical protein